MREMSTAPRDGTRIDVYLGDVSESERIWYCGLCNGRWSIDWHFVQGKFRPFLHGAVIPTFVKPTGWRPRDGNANSTF